MAISNYTELQAAVTNWLGDAPGGLSAALPDLITLGEARLNRELRLLRMATTASVTITSGSDTAALPAGFLDIIDLYYASDQGTAQKDEDLTQVDPDLIVNEYNDESGAPEYFAIADTFLFDREANQAYTLTCRHFRKWDIATDTTNWLLTNYPDAYLFAALHEAALYLQHDERAALWDAKATRAIRELNVQDARVRGRAPLRVDDALMRRGRAATIDRGPW